MEKAEASGPGEKRRNIRVNAKTNLSFTYSKFRDKKAKAYNDFQALSPL